MIHREVGRRQVGVALQGRLAGARVELADAVLVNGELLGGGGGARQEAGKQPSDRRSARTTSATGMSLPTAHRFDELLGNLYHLNAEEENENPDYPKDPAFAKRFGTRGVLQSYADGKIEDTGLLTKKRMETVEEDFAGEIARVQLVLPSVAGSGASLASAAP